LLRNVEQRLIRFERHNKIQKSGAIETDRLTFVNRRHHQLAIMSGERIQRRANMPLRLDIAANAHIHARHYLLPLSKTPRSMVTPTACAAGTAVGLVTVSRSHGTPNSCMTNAAHCSAMVSINANARPLTNSLRRTEMAW